MKLLLPRILLVVCRNLLILEAAVGLFAALFTWFIQLYFTETVGLFLIGAGMLLTFTGLVLLSSPARIQPHVEEDHWGSVTASKWFIR